MGPALASRSRSYCGRRAASQTVWHAICCQSPVVGARGKEKRSPRAMEGRIATPSENDTTVK